MSALAVSGRRFYIAGHRCHHGLLGALMALLGGALCWHDRADFPWAAH